MFVPVSVGLVPEVTAGVYVSVPAVVVDRTVKLVEPALVICGFDVSSVSDAPPPLRVTEYVPVPVELFSESRTFTVATDVAEPSGGMLLGVNAQLRWFGEPAVHDSVAVRLVRLGDEKVTEHPLYAPALENAKVVRPFDAVSVAEATPTLPPPAPVHVFGSSVAVTTAEPLPVTRFPFTSWMRTR